MYTFIIITVAIENSRESRIFLVNSSHLVNILSLPALIESLCGGGKLYSQKVGGDRMMISKCTENHSSCI